MSETAINMVKIQNRVSAKVKFYIGLRVDYKPPTIIKAM